MNTPYAYELELAHAIIDGKPVWHPERWDDGETVKWDRARDAQIDAMRDGHLLFRVVQVGADGCRKIVAATTRDQFSDPRGRRSGA